MAVSSLTLNALLQGENLEEVKQNAHELVRFTDQFPETLPFMHPVSEDELWSMIKLSEDIGRSLDKIVTLRKPIPHTAEIQVEASCASSCIPDRPQMKRVCCHLPHHPKRIQRASN
ncbi:hypothetical protein PT974_10971 [Cladobotryum mycophilum]|uniref:Uncharacterized protein n=1 Tax=Cladobotryum mycophilum TaxID=491253 RepID=A0ABR0SBA6_9HYPO